MKSVVLAVVAVLSLAVPAQAADTFQPSSTSWATKSRGWVLGVDGKDPALLRTTDGGASWQRLSVPGVSTETDRMRVHFANEVAGLLTDGQRLFVTRTGGTTWQEVYLPTPQRVSFGALGSDAGALYVVVSGPSRTQLYTAPVWDGGFAPVTGVSIAGAAEGDIAALGPRAYVVLSKVHEETRYWARTRFGGWEERKPPCDVSSATRLSATEDTVFALCSWNPGMGYMFKELLAAKPDGPFSSVSEGPIEGITMDFAAASASTTVVSAVGLGAGFLHRSVNGVWSTPFAEGGPPLFDLTFTDSFTGFVVRGGHHSEVSELYRTSDGGASWTRMIF